MPKHPAWKATETIITGLGRWATTDHTGTAKLLAKLQPMGLMDTLKFHLIHLLGTILGAVVSAFLFYLLIAHGIHLLLGV